MIASPTSIYNILCDAGLIAQRQVKQQLLTNENQKRLLIFAKQYLNHDWKKTLITNKKHFLLWLPPNRNNYIIWDKHGIEYYFKQKQYPPPQIHVWGGLLYHGVCNLVEYNGTITANHYQHIIHCALPSIEALFPWPNFYFQQDGASAHHANSAVKFLKIEMPNNIPKED